MSSEDLTIIDKILSFWFPSNEYQDFWFNSTKDEIIIKDFKLILDKAELGEFKEWENNEKGILALIILFDQFTRNIYRNNNIERKKNDGIALKLASYLINNNLDLNYPLNHRIFILLPYRHQKMTHLLNIIMERLNIYEKEKDINIKLLEKFRMATIKSYSEVKDSTIEYFEEKKRFYDNNKDILDDNCSVYRNKIEQLKFNIDNTNLNIYDCKLLQNIIKFLKNVGNNINIAVSLSGGVDSMVLIHICKLLEINKIINKVIAIHLEYNNRKESKDECELLVEWCTYMKIPIIIKKVVHIQREDKYITREFYETETKKIRFNLYKDLIEKYNLYGICLGHHKGDITDNILMNIFRGADLLNLSGMSNDSIINDVRICRPMIDNHKSDIYDYAHKYFIPYFKDSTPDWSCRGVIRRKVIPVLETQYKEGLYINLEKIGKSSQEYGTLIEQFIINPILVHNIKFTCFGSYIRLDEKLIKMPFVIWSKILNHIFNTIKYKNITFNCINKFINWLTTHNNNKIKFNNNCLAFIDNETNILYFLNNSLENISVYKNFTNNNKINNLLNINGWKITTKEYTQEFKIQENIKLLDVFSGKYSYICKSSINQELCLIKTFDKKDLNRKVFSKLSHFKGIVPKISNSIISNDEKIKLYMIEIEYTNK